GLFAGAPRSLRIVGMAAALLAFAGAVGLLVAEQHTVGVPMSDLLRTATGRPYLWLVVATLAAAAGAVLAAARERWRAALWGAGVVGLTGLLRAVSELGGMSNLLDGLRATYGLTLLAKVAVGLVLIGLGATNRLRNVALLAEDERPLRRFVTAETVFALGVLVLTGVLTGLSPPVTAASAATGPPPVAGSATGADFATTTRVALTMSPGFAGPNAFRAEVTGY